MRTRKVHESLTRRTEKQKTMKIVFLLFVLYFLTFFYLYHIQKEANQNKSIIGQTIVAFHKDAETGELYWCIMDNEGVVHIAKETKKPSSEK
jgi:hypothetical protein